MIELNWYTAVPIFLSYVIAPGIAFIFFCRFLKSPAKPAWCAVYAVLYTALGLLESHFHMGGCLGLCMEAALLSGIGCLVSGKPRQKIFAIAALTESALSVVGGIISWISHRILAPAVLFCPSLVLAGDGLRELLKAAGILAVLFSIRKLFGKAIEEAEGRLLLWMAIPAVFISMIERTIQDSIYNDSLIVNTVTREYGSVVEIRHGELLFLQIFAAVCLFLTLFACERLVKAFQEIQKTRLLEQQAKVQAVYIQEAALRYQQTQSFRHDIRNHLAVLSSLLKDNQTEEAEKYLTDLGEAAAGLSWQVHTGNTAADALLSSKLSAAAQNKISVSCTIQIPKESKVKDLDWCILLSNALDNAIKACRDLKEEERYLKIETRRKGNFYLLLIENSCGKALSKLPRDGTGLSNIRSVMKKYQGTAENQISQGTYKLKLLFTDL